MTNTAMLNHDFAPNGARIVLWSVSTNIPPLTGLYGVGGLLAWGAGIWRAPYRAGRGGSSSASTSRAFGTTPARNARAATL